MPPDVAGVFGIRKSAVPSAITHQVDCNRLGDAMNQDKEEYEVGIPLDDLSSVASTPDREDGEPTEEQDSAPADDGDPPIDPPESEDLGLPSLFDEDELAEVGLKASPFGDGDDMEGPGLDIAGSSEAPGAPAHVEAPPEDGAPTADLEADLQGFDGAEGFLDPEDTPPEQFEMDAAPEENEPETADDAVASAPPGDLRDQLNVIQEQLAQLSGDFSGKLKYDAHKDQIIDKLHQELQEYKQDIVKKHILSIVLDVVKVADDIRKWLAYFRSLDVSQRDPVKLFRYLEAIPSDLEDIFYWQGVKPYTHREGAFNPATQRAIKKIPTDDPTKDKAVAKSIRPGYEWESKVIRQEMVAVYVYEDGNESVDTRNIDE